MGEDAVLLAVECDVHRPVGGERDPSVRQAAQPHLDQRREVDTHELVEREDRQRRILGQRGIEGGFVLPREGCFIPVRGVHGGHVERARCADAVDEEAEGRLLHVGGRRPGRQCREVELDEGLQGLRRSLQLELVLSAVFARVAQLRVRVVRESGHGSQRRGRTENRKGEREGKS